MMQRWWRGVRSRVDARDVCLLAGLGLTSGGSYWISPPVGLLAPGVILLWLALSPAASRRN